MAPGISFPNRQPDIIAVGISLRNIPKNQTKKIGPITMIDHDLLVFFILMRQSIPSAVWKQLSK